MSSYGNIVATELRNASNEIVTAGQEGALLELFGFTARPFDVDTALQNNLHRWYDPSTGRWMSEDPMGFAAGDANLYRYVENTSVSGIDPAGLRRTDIQVVGNFVFYDVTLARPTWGDLSHIFVFRPGINILAGEENLRRCFFMPIEPTVPDFPDDVPTGHAPTSGMISLYQEDGCCRPLTVGFIINRANQALAQPNCLAWFRDHGLEGTVRWNVRCHGRGKPMCRGFPAWTFPGAAIGLCENWLDSEGEVTFASLLIHELAHHYCGMGPGREECAMSAQDACQIP